MAEFLFYLVIYPIHLLIELSYRICYELFKSAGCSIIGVSFAVTLLCLPLYDIAEKWQKIERKTQAKLKDGIKRIKSTFHGDEQYMILSTFYRENHYHPMMALRSSLGLIIQIPFFIAAYIFLSKTLDLNGYDFYFISDFSKPDSIIRLKALGIQFNLLPILMTLINIAAGAIYTRGFELREKLQIYGMALVFLLILYDSPSGLVLYWTMNNVFSLVKNIFYKLKNPLKVFRLIMTLLFTMIGVFVFIKMKPYQSVPVFFLAAVTFVSPKLVKLINLLQDSVFCQINSDRKLCFSVFIISAISLSLLSGLVIPSLLINSSTQADFAYIDGYSSPLYFIYVCFLECTGLFLLWPLVIYFLYGKNVRNSIAALFYIILVCGVINTFCFQGDYGNISADLVFTEHKEIKPELIPAFINILVLLLFAAFSIFSLWKKIFITKSISFILVIALIAISFLNCISIQKNFQKTSKPVLQEDKIEPVFSLSSSDKNVIVLMLDKAPGYFVETIFNIRPELNSSFDGFTFYPDTVSFGSWTIQGAPGLYGGYEYTPWEMNKRREISMQEKHNQALRLIPEIFAENGFNSYLIDPPYPNYDEKPVFSFLDGSKIKPLVLTGKYSDIWYQENEYEKKPVKSNRIKRNLMWFSIFKISPLSLRSVVHYKDWWSNTVNVVESTSDFIDRLSVLDYLPELTEIKKGKGSLIIMDNESTHNPGFVNEKDCRPTEMNFSEILHANHPFGVDPGFHAMIASFCRLAEWFDYLKENGVYDNTKIIIVSDHGSYQNMPVFSEQNKNLKLPRNIEWFNPVLMVKDYNSYGNLKIDRSFMTQADVPAIAFEGAVSNPVNPFTNKKIRTLSLSEKNEKAKISFSKANKVLATENNGFIISDDEWYSVKDSIFDTENWKKLKVHNGELEE